MLPVGCTRLVTHGSKPKSRTDLIPLPLSATVVRLIVTLGVAPMYTGPKNYLSISLDHA